MDSFEIHEDVDGLVIVGDFSLISNMGQDKFFLGTALCETHPNVGLTERFQHANYIRWGTISSVRVYIVTSLTLAQFNRKLFTYMAGNAKMGADNVFLSFLPDADAVVAKIREVSAKCISVNGDITEKFGQWLQLKLDEESQGHFAYACLMDFGMKMALITYEAFLHHLRLEFITECIIHFGINLTHDIARPSLNPRLSRHGVLSFFPMAVSNAMSVVIRERRAGNLLDAINVYLAPNTVKEVRAYEPVLMHSRTPAL